MIWRKERGKENLEEGKIEWWEKEMRRGGGGRDDKWRGI